MGFVQAVLLALLAPSLRPWLSQSVFAHWTPTRCLSRWSASHGNPIVPRLCRGKGKQNECCGGNVSRRNGSGRPEMQAPNYSPTHVLSHSSRYQPRHSYSMSVFWHVHSARNGVPRMPKMASRQLLGLPAHLSVELSMAHACSYCSSRARHSGSSWHSSATVWHAGCVAAYTTPFDAFRSMVSGFFAHAGCIFSWARRHASLRCGDLLATKTSEACNVHDRDSGCGVRVCVHFLEMVRTCTRKMRCLAKSLRSPDDKMLAVHPDRHSDCTYGSHNVI